MVRIFCAGRRGIHTGFLKNLSAGGMFLRILDPEPAGTRLHFELRLHPRRPETVTGSGEVVWARESYAGPGRAPGMGIRFLALTPEGAEELRRLVGSPVDAAVERNGGAGDDLLPPALLEELGRSGESDLDPEIEILDPHVEIPASTPVPGESAAPSPRASADEETETEPPSDGGRDVAREYGLPTSRPAYRRAGIVALVALLAAVGLYLGFDETPSDPAPAEVVEPAASERGGPVAPAAIASPEEAPPDPAETAEPAPLPPLSRVDSIAWEPAPGGLVVVIRGDGELEDGRATYSHIGGEAPRAVVRIRGVERASDRVREEIPEGPVLAIRTGFHEAEGGRGDLHVVLDLRSPGASITGIRPSGRDLLVYVGGP